MYNSNILVILLLVGTFFTSTITILPAAYSERGDDDGRSGDENKQRVEEEGAGALNDCDAVENEFEDTTFENVNECIAIADTDESIVRERETPPPDGDGGTPTPDGPFTISGQGSGTLTCLGASQDASISISAEEAEDGSVTGSVNVIIPNSGGIYSVTGGTTDGNTFSLTGETNTSVFCGIDVQQFTVSGDCGTAATITYEEPDVSATFTGDVECTFA